MPVNKISARHLFTHRFALAGSADVSIKAGKLILRLTSSGRNSSNIANMSCMDPSITRDNPKGPNVGLEVQL